MNKIFVFGIIVFLILGLSTCYGFYITPKQIKFTDLCVRRCLDLNMSSDVIFHSTWKVNGVCYCKQEQEIRE